ncbi:MAG: hypothetical protein Q9220_000460 [cf. Caloplaca sp. 1 TL-2023]
MLLATVFSGIVAFLPTILALSAQKSWSFKLPYGVSRGYSIRKFKADEHSRLGSLTLTIDSIDVQHTGSSSEIDLPATLRSSIEYQDRTYSDALKLLESMRASPSCNRLAVYTLIRSCQSLDGSAISSEGSLEDLKSVYAVQLALCEITEAGTKSPDDCRHFLPSDQSRASHKASNHFNQQGLLNGMRKDKLGLCLQSLESRPQHWISYSNNRQNAVVMCQAARKDVDKDDLIQTHKVAVDTASGANAALGRAVNAANEALLKQEAFGREVEHLNERLKQDLKATATETQSFLGTLLKNLESVYQRSIDLLLSKVENIEHETDKVEETLRTSIMRTGELKSNIDRVFQQALEGSAELAASQASQWDETSSELRSSLQGIRDHGVQPLLGAFNSINDQLRASNELVASIHMRQHELDDRLTKLDSSLASLGTAAAALEENQAAEAERLQVRFQVVHGYIAETVASMVSLQNTINDASSKVTHMVAFGGLAAQLSNWGWSLAILLVLYQLQPKLAGYALVISGISFFVSTMGLPYITDVLGYTIDAAMVYRVLLLCGFFMGLALILRMSHGGNSISRQLVPVFWFCRAIPTFDNRNGKV